MIFERHGRDGSDDNGGKIGPCTQFLSEIKKEEENEISYSKSR
jgi:hypothetical protein